MSRPAFRRLARRTQKPTTRTSPAALFLTLSAEGADELGNQRSLTRKAFVAFVAAVLLLAAPLYAVANAQGAEQGKAVLVKSSSEDDDGDDRDDDETGNNDTGTGQETAAGNTDQPGLETGNQTRGETDGGDGTGATETGQTTGRETQAGNTDRAGVQTFGASTRGETDPGDHTGKTEVR